jgi:Domain of unknown function (DUF4328)
MNCRVCGLEIPPGRPSCERCGTPTGSEQAPESAQASAAGQSPPPADHSRGGQWSPITNDPYGGPPPQAGGGPYGGPPPQAGGGPYGGPPPQAANYPLGGLATALTVLLALQAAASLAALAAPVLGLPAFLLMLGVIPVFIVWFYRARKNADGRGWRQRRGPGWAIGAWFVPVIALWFPYQIMADIWRAGLPAEQRSRRAWQPITWWACWLLAWFTGFRYTNSRTGNYSGVSVGFFLGDTAVSRIFEVAAAIAAIVVVRAVSSSGVGRAAPTGQAWT